MFNLRSAEHRLLLSLFTLSLASVAPACAQYDVPSTATAGEQEHSSADEVGAKLLPQFSYPTGNQKIVLQPTATARLTPSFGPVGLNGLPPCTMDSFVRCAGASADLIYGDEGTDGPPPYSEFTQIHRIESGIYGDRKKGLTTGHRSNLPSAWGADEFLGAEWYRQPGASFSDTADNTNADGKQ